MRSTALALLLAACSTSSSNDAPAREDSGADMEAPTDAGDGSTPPDASDARDTGAPPDASRSPTDGGAPGALGEWVWQDVEGTMCANGSPTGIGINRGAGDRVVVYMSGGSACLDQGCSIGTPSMRKDGGFGAAQLKSCVEGACDGSVTFPAESLFDRAQGASPFSDATYVFISNCSGDYYVGDNEHAFAGWTAQFHGWRNQRLIAEWLVASFPDTARVVLTGGSAGAVGALLNYWQWVEAFEGTRVDLIADSFAFIYEDGPQWRYNLHNPQVPPGCPECATDYRAVYDFNASIAPGSRIAILDSEKNFTLDLVTGFKYADGLRALQLRLDALANTRYYVANGNVHILMQYPLDNAAIDVTDATSTRYLLSDFLAAMQQDDAAWQNRTCL